MSRSDGDATGGIRFFPQSFIEIFDHLRTFLTQSRSFNFIPGVSDILSQQILLNNFYRFFFTSQQININLVFIIIRMVVHVLVDDKRAKVIIYPLAGFISYYFNDVKT